MKQLLLALVCLVSVSAMADTQACASKKNQKLAEELPTTARFSNQFRFFWQDFVYEVNNTRKGLKKYKPSEEMVKFHALAQDGNDYILTGYVQTAGKNFDVEAARKMGVTLNMMLTDIYSFRCPLRLLPEFIALPGLKTVEAGKQLKQLHQPTDKAKEEKAK